MTNIEQKHLSSEQIEAAIAKIKKDLYKFLTPLVIAGLWLTSCVPEVSIIDTKPKITLAVENPTPNDTKEITLEPGEEIEVASATPVITTIPENTATSTAINTPEATATPELSEQDKIRAEFLAAGIDPDDLANSSNEWVSGLSNIESLQNDFENSFGTEKEGFETVIVLSLEEVDGLQELNNAVKTDGGWQMLLLTKVGWKMANGDLALAYLPLVMYHSQEEKIWFKLPEVSTPAILQGKVSHNAVNNFTNTEDRWDIQQQETHEELGYYLGPGTFMELFTGYPELDNSTNDCMVEWLSGGLPTYSENDLIEFRQTGDPEIFNYYQKNGLPVLWPIVTFQASLNKLEYYQ